MIVKIAKGALALLLALGMAGCTSGTTTPTDSPIANLPNPMVSVDSADAFSAAGVNIDAPADATDVSYYIISGTLAGVQFTYDGEEYTYRASAKDSNISGIYYELTAQCIVMVECDGFCVDATVYAAEDKGKLVEWEHDGIHYALWHAGDTDDEKLTAALTGVMARTFNGVQSDPVSASLDFSKDGECEVDLDGDGLAEKVSIAAQSGEQYMIQDYCTLSVKDASGAEHTMNLQIQWATIATAYDFDADGGFDEQFFMYYEDTDLSFRMKAGGGKIMYCPDSIVRHIHTGSSTEWSPFFTYHVYRNKLLFLYKNFNKKLFFMYFIRQYIDGMRSKDIQKKRGCKDAYKIAFKKEKGITYQA